MPQTKPSSTDLCNWLVLSLTPQVGPKTGIKLLNAFGSVDNIFNQTTHTLAQFINPNVAKLILARSANNHANKMLEWLELNSNHNIIPISDSRYPKELKAISDPPLVLYLMGNIGLLNKKKITLVGTKNPSQYGLNNAFKFAQNLSEQNFTIVSGMAPGIDTHAHLGALKAQGSTIAVMGCGFNTPIIKSQQELNNQIHSNGLFISEFPIDTYSQSINFERRNRIISGLSIVCLVVESGLDNESLITANYALEMGREVMAIPGSIHNPGARGCHKLIKSGAKLVETINDILEEIQPEQYKKNDIRHTDNSLLLIMGNEPITIDTICNKLNAEFTEICAKLLELELAGQIVNCGNGHYQQIFQRNL